jgi:hypothetical protein
MMKKLALAVALVLMTVPLARASSVPVWEYTTAGTVSDSRLFTIGFSFATTTPFQIDNLGYFDDGLSASHEVGLWDTAGNLLASTTVLGSSPLIGHFKYSPVSFLLNPGTYVLGGEYLGGNAPIPLLPAGVTLAAGYSFVADRQIVGAGLNFPTITEPNLVYGPGIGSVNFTVAQADPVPEPASLLLLGTGLIGAGARRWRKRRESDPASSVTA